MLRSIVLIVFVFQLACGASQAVSEDIEGKEQTSFQTSDSIEDSSSKTEQERTSNDPHIVVKKDHTVILGRKAPNADSLQMAVHDLTPLVPELRHANIEEPVIEIDPGVRMGFAFKVMSTLALFGFERVHVRTDSGLTAIVFPKVDGGFASDIQIVLELQGVRLLLGELEVPPVPGCEVPGPTFCAQDGRTDLGKLVDVLNRTPRPNEGDALELYVVVYDATPSEDLLDVLSLFGGDNPTVKAKVGIATFD